MLSSTTFAACSGGSWRLRYTNSRLVSASLRFTSATSISSSRASFNIWSAVISMSAGLAATDSTGVEIASGSLLRSTIMPRVAESAITRE